MTKQSPETMDCPMCGGTMVLETRSDTITYKGESRSLEVLGWWCTECEEAIFEADALAECEMSFRRLKAQVDGILSPAEVKQIREHLGLSQRQAGALLGGGPHAFYKYEAGLVSVSQPMSNLLRLLDKDPTRLNDLRADRVS